MGKLSAQGIKNAGPGKYEDGDGLRLVVSATGAKKWVLRITVAGKRREMGLGSYPLISLAEAREKALVARKSVVKGQDPIASRKVELVAEVPPEMPTFTQVAARYIRAHRHGWSNIKHARQWCATLKTYARPTLGNKAINTISTEEVLKVLTPIWKKKTETAKRVQGRMENIFDFAAARKWRDANNPARWRGHLDKLLPRPT
ncbi:MAG TPA: integrase arm-type DNA-binding domain-containing protein, partial [Chromatiaceae bacterium]|nr:integrase arm-type DNA-binding domain-containing protein [Chromatiaceae bacterium]